MTLLLDRINADRDLAVPIQTAAFRFIDKAPNPVLTCTPAVSAVVASGKEVLGGIDDNTDINTDNAADPADPANNQVNY